MAALAAVMALVGMASPSMAASSYWYGQQNTSNPTIYQTNLTYATSPFVFPASTPSTSQIVEVGYTWRIANPVPAGTTLQVELCRDAGTVSCYVVNQAAVGSTQASGWVTNFNGLSARANFYLRLRLVATNTYVISPSIPSSFYWLQVNYSY